MVATIQTHHNALGDPRAGPCPKSFHQPAAQFPRPVANEEFDHLRLVRTKFSALSPVAAGHVRAEYASRISGVRLVVGAADLPNGGFLSRWRGKVVKAHLLAFGHRRKLRSH